MINLHECKCLIIAIKKLRYLVENEEKQSEEEKEVKFSFKELYANDLGGDIRLSIDYIKKPNDYEYNYPIKTDIFNPYFTMALNNLKTKILREMISLMKENMKEDKDFFYEKISEFITDFNDTTK